MIPPPEPKEHQFWTADSVSQAGFNSRLRVPKTVPKYTGSESESDRTLAKKSRLEKSKALKKTAEQGVGTDGSPFKKRDNRLQSTPRYTVSDLLVKHAARASSSTSGNHRGGEQRPTSTEAVGRSSELVRPSDNESDNDHADVEAMLDTESDTSQGPSRGVSFAFSNIESRNASLTSLSSTASVDSRTGKKRTLDYSDTRTPIVGATNSRKTARTAQKPTATYTSPPEPKTPPRKIVGLSYESPSPYHTTVATPTIKRVNAMMEGLHTQGSSSSRADVDDQILVDSVTPSGIHVIAHSKEAQVLFDRIPLSWGVQYELARGVSLGKWSWADVLRADLNSLRGPNNNSAARVSQVVLTQASANVTATDMAIWTELDREEAAICERRNRGLGLQGDWQEKTKWYGGQIQQIARLEETALGAFRLVLTKMEMRKSHRFGRFLASRRLLQVSVPQSLVNSSKPRLDEFFKQKFVLCGRTFVLCGSKDSKVFLLEVPESYERPCRVRGDEQRMTLEDFVQWHNPLGLNGQQPVAKWVTRFDLGFSISVPTVMFAPKWTCYCNDRYVEDHAWDAKVSAEHIYTDGCGFINETALKSIAKHIGLEGRLTAVQGRIAGAKGLWVLHPTDRGVEPKIWIRASQKKIQLNLEDPHPAHRIFDLLAPPRVTLPSRLSRLTILNLAHNQVPLETFVELMRDTLEEKVKPLTDWKGDKATLLLWREVEKVGGVTLKRILQHAQGTTRALGLTGRIREEEAEWDDELADPKVKDLLEQLGDLGEDEVPSVTVLRDLVTGEPSTIHGVVLDLLQSGFTPLKLKLLYDKLKYVVTRVIEDVIHDYHISVPLSAEAFIVPDPCDVLKEGEIHFKSTKNLKDPIDDPNPNILLGDVLIYRNPCRLPSDVRKVTAVQHPRLAEYTDVIVLPAVGPVSFASILAGGDYDGDVCVCIYDPRLVDSFVNSPISHEPDNFMKANFEDLGNIQQVSEMADELEQLKGDPDARRQRLQESLLLGLSNPPVGQYSKFHENAAYVHGYDAPETVRLAFMFNTVLDSRKTGHRVRPEVYKRDKMQYDRIQPDSLKSSKDTLEQGNVVKLKREHGLGRFVLDELMAAGKRMRDAQLVRYDGLLQAASFGYKEQDPELLEPYQKVQELMDDPDFRDDPKYQDFGRIKAHIDDHIRRWQRITSESKLNPMTPSKRASASSSKASRAGSTSSAKSKREKYEALARSFAAGPEIAKNSPFMLVDIELLKASWAYAEKPNFAWKVAFQALCRIKASTRAPVAFTSEFGELMSMSSTAGRVLEQCRLTAQGLAT